MSPLKIKIPRKLCVKTQQTHQLVILFINYVRYLLHEGVRGGAVVEALRYKPEGSGFDSRWCHSIFH
jgi:hypothetical protein